MEALCSISQSNQRNDFGRAKAAKTGGALAGRYEEDQHCVVPGYGGEDEPPLCSAALLAGMRDIRFLEVVPGSEQYAVFFPREECGRLKEWWWELQI